MAQLVVLTYIVPEDIWKNICHIVLMITRKKTFFRNRIVNLWSSLPEKVPAAQLFPKPSRVVEGIFAQGVFSHVFLAPRFFFCPSS